MNPINIIAPIFFILLNIYQIQSYNQTSTELWCPNAYCKNTGKCRPCDKHFIFVLAQGRSGSTTLKNMLNLLPGMRISGEIGDTIEKMEDIWSYLIDEEENLVKARGNINDRWGHNKYPPEYLSCAAQKFVEALNPPEKFSDGKDPDTIIGFKELRIDTLRQVEFLLTHFPCSRFIFNVRSDPLSLKFSQKKWLKNDDLLDKSQKVPLVHRYMQQRLGASRVYYMDMVEWSEGDGKEFNLLASWLGYENCVFPSVFHDNLVVQNKWMTDKDRFTLDWNCRLKQF